MTTLLPHRSFDPADDQNLFGPVVQLSTLAAGLGEIPLGPRPAFRAELRARILDEFGRSPVAPCAAPPVGGQDEPAGAGTSAGTSAGTNRRGERYRRRAAVAGLALALTGGGVAAAAGGSLPGEPLYPVKRLGQSVRLALDPGTGSSLRLVSSRISEVQRTAAIDPQGTDASRWSAADAALADADSRLVQLSASTSAQALSTALSPDRARVAQLLATVPAAHQSAVRRLADTIDALSAVPVTGGDPIGADLLPTGLVSPSAALADGWPLDPATLLPSSTPPAANPAKVGRAVQDAGVPTTTNRGGTRASSAHANSHGSTPTAAGSSGVLPQLPSSSPQVAGGSPRPASQGGILSRTPSGVGSTIDPTVDSLLGGTGSGGPSSGAGGVVGGVDPTIGGLIGGTTDGIGPLPGFNTVSPTTTLR